MPCYLRIWTGLAPRLTLVDMTNADRRGEKCKVLTLVARTSNYRVVEYLNEDFPHRLNGYLPQSAAFDTGAFLDQSFDSLAEILWGFIAAYESDVVFTEETLQGVHAPKPVLEMDIFHKFKVRADENGVVLTEWTPYRYYGEFSTGNQSGPAAYRLTKQVWDELKQAPGFDEAAMILTSAGCALEHSRHLR